ncbi:MAG: Vgb family protein [Ilumatobacteraceae bacterium]
MADGTIVMKALFESLDAEPRPEFLATLRRRIEAEAVGESVPAARSNGHGRPVPIELELPNCGQPGRRRGRRWNVAIALTAVAALVAVLVFVTRARDDVTPVDVPATTNPTTSAAPSLPATTVLPAVEELGGRLRATVPVENTADSIAVTDDAVWVSGWDESTVSRIDARTNEVTTVDVGFAGTRVAADEDGVWVGVDGGRLLRLDPDSGEVIATIEMGADTGSWPVTGDGSVWVRDANDVSRVDPQTNEVTATVDLTTGIGDDVGGMVVTGGLVWANTCGGPVSIDPQTLAVSDPIALDGCASDIGFADGSLWVGLAGRRTARIDPVAREVEVILDVGPVDEAPGLATGSGAVWRPLTTSTIARIDTATNAVTEVLDLGRIGQPAGLVIGNGSLWAGDYGRRTVLRIDQGVGAGPAEPDGTS